MALKCRRQTHGLKYQTFQAAQPWIWPILQKNPQKLVLHVGTNSLKGRETSTHCAQEIMELAESVKSSVPNTEIAVSIWPDYAGR